MKKMLSVLLLLAVGYVPSWSSPKKEESKVAVVRHGDVFRVIYEAPHPSVVKVTISDPSGKELFTEKIVGDRFARPYNFSQLPKGDFILCVQDENSSQIKTICHHENTWLAQLVKIRASESKYLVAIPRQPNSDMVVSVYDQNNQLVYSEPTSGEDDFARVYDLRNLAGGSIQISHQQSGEVKVLSVE